MLKLIAIGLAFGVLCLPSVAVAQPATPPAPLLKEKTTEIPKVPEHEARVFLAEIGPNSASAWHTHPAPVFVYVLQGTLSWELDGQDAKEYKAGQAFAEPANKKNRAVNKGTELVKVIVFQVSDPGEALSKAAQ
jgi:quercetin dioxygenase-like cupin family protein